MKILFVMGDPHLPQYTGGAQSSSHEMALELIRLGHEVRVISKLVPTGFVGMQNRIRRKFSNNGLAYDKIPGYPVYRQWNVRESLAAVVDEFKPDVAIAQIGHQISLSAELYKHGVPTLVYLRNVEMNELDGNPGTVPGLRFVANSEFTARRFRDAFGISATVVPPFFIPERYVVKSAGKNVTLVNPHPLKGLNVALEVARSCPDIPFCFVESWSLGKQGRAEIAALVKTVPNVTLKSRTSNMKSIYADAKIILMPSQWEEAWGRVASEAQFSGIPVVSSNRGGLPESVGPGGVLLNWDASIEEWVGAVRRLWSDDGFYGEKSAAALVYAKRPEIDRACQIASLLQLMQGAVDAKSRSIA